MLIDEKSRVQTGTRVGLDFAQTGKILPMLGLSLKILLLSIVTLSLYRFWGRTEVRRSLWGHTIINGEPLDYLGKGSELFIGFLLALILYLFPLGLALNVILYLWPPDPASGLSSQSVPYMIGVEVLLVYLIAVGLYQALRYRLSRTAWHGIRFALEGSAFGFGLRVLGFLFLNMLTLGWLTPLMEVRLFRRIAANTFYGDKAFRFEGKARALYWPFAMTYFLMVTGFGGFAVGMAMFFANNAAIAGGTAPAPAAWMHLLPYLISFWVAALLLALLFGAIYAAARLRVMGSGLRYEGLSFTLEARTFSYLWLTLSNLFLAALTLGIAVPVTELRRFRYIFSRFSTRGDVDLASIGPCQGPRPRFGEGLAEAFGFGNV